MRRSLGQETQVLNIWWSVCGLLGCGALLDKNQGWNLAFDEGWDIMKYQDIKA